MGRLAITPWRYTSDLLTVRQQLYRLGGDNDERQDAVDRIMAWRLRGNLPHAVESTALIIDAIKHHENPGNSTFSIRAVYSAAFCRFVTGYCDIGRNKERSLESSSMLEIAKQIDMPLEFVALRHEATHEEFPSEPRIVRACEDALQWLWKVYWSRLDEANKHEQLSIEGVRTCTRQIFRDHRSAVKAHLKSRGGQMPREGRPSPPSPASAAQLVTKLLSETSPPSNGAYDAIAQEIIESDILLPSQRSSKASMDSAYFLWDDLLLAIDTQARPLLLAIINKMLFRLGAVSHAADLDMYRAWLAHLAGHIHDLTPHILRYCVIYSSQQTLLLGQGVLDSSDDATQEQWLQLLDASRFEVDSKLQAVEPDTNGMLDRLHEDSLSRWQRMVLPPSGAIGVRG